MESMVIRPEREYKTVMFIGWAIVLVLVSTALLLLTIFIPNRGGKIVFGNLLLLFLAIMVLWGFWIPAYYRTLLYTINGEAVRTIGGVFWKKYVTVPYTKITNVDVTQGPLQRKFDIGTVHVQTAGAGGAQGARAEIILAGIRDCEGVKNTIMDGMRGQASEPRVKTPAGTGDAAVLRSILEELKKIRTALEK